jgi:hypothetical protein
MFFYLLCVHILSIYHHISDLIKETLDGNIITSLISLRGLLMDL